jgi:hypothetical protein
MIKIKSLQNKTALNMWVFSVFSAVFEW